MWWTAATKSPFTLSFLEIAWTTCSSSKGVKRVTRHHRGLQRVRPGMAVTPAEKSVAAAQ
jgi:hypothetical protein